MFYLFRKDNLIGLNKFVDHRYICKSTDVSLNRMVKTSNDYLSDILKLNLKDSEFQWLKSVVAQISKAQSRKDLYMAYSLCTAKIQDDDIIRSKTVAKGDSKGDDLGDFQSFYTLFGARSWRRIFETGTAIDSSGG